MNQPEWQTKHQQCMVSKENYDKGYYLTFQLISEIWFIKNGLYMSFNCYKDYDLRVGSWILRKLEILFSETHNLL